MIPNPHCFFVIAYEDVTLLNRLIYFVLSVAANGNRPSSPPQRISKRHAPKLKTKFMNTVKKPVTDSF